MKTPSSSRLVTIAIVVLLIAVVVGIGLLAATPPVSRDALTHHLAVPKLYLEAGGMVELPDIPFSYYPMNLDLLYALPLYFGNDILPKFIHFLFALLTAWGIGAYLKGRFGPPYGLLGAVLFLSTPVVVRLSSTVYVDLGLCCFTFFSMRYLLKWAQEDYRLSQLVLAGAMCGLALGTKYNALVVFSILTLMVPWLRTRYPQTGDAPTANRSGRTDPALGSASRKGRLGPPITAMTVFILVALLLFTPWMARNIHWTGNPVYPLYDHWFNPDSQAPREQGEIRSRSQPPASMPPLVSRRLVYNEPFWYTALIPIRIFFEGRDDNPQYFDGKLNPFFLLMAAIPFAGWRRRPVFERRDDGIWLWFTVLLILFTFFSAAMRIRYIVAIVPPLVILTVSGFHRLAAGFRRKLGPGKKWAVCRLAMSFVPAAMLTYNAVYLLDLHRRYTPLAFLSGELDRDQYIEKFRPEFPLYRHANVHLEKNDLILGMFLGNRRYYSDIPLSMNESLFWNAVRDAGTPEEMATMLCGQGITHLMVRLDVLNFWARNNLNKVEIQVLQSFFKTSLTVLVKSGDYRLYRVVPAPTVLK